MLRFLAFLVVLALLAGGVWYWEQVNFEAPGPLQAHRIVTVAPGDHVNTIAQHLADAGVIANADLFRVGLRLRNLQTELKAGEYDFLARASMADVASILISGNSIQHKLTIAEGLTSNMILRLVEADPVLVQDKPLAPLAEGTLLPETYLFTRGVTKLGILIRMRDAQRKLLDKLWPIRSSGLPFASPRDAVILASIVEKETALPDERRHIAAVFMNRIRLGMKLQSDPTIIYGITKGYPLGRGIRESELLKPTPYNTYAIAGMPPTPICNPGKDAIAAVLDPAISNDLYFVANGTGGHVFSATIAEHEKNVARWRHIENPRPPPPPKPVSRHRHKLPKLRLRR